MNGLPFGFILGRDGVPGTGPKCRECIMHFLIEKKTESFSAQSVAMDVDIRSDKRIKCGICNDYFKDPTTLPCGHNFCKGCISNHWDTEMYRDSYGCPDCSKTFFTRPELTTNETLAVIGNKLQKWTLQDSVQHSMVTELKNKFQKPPPQLRDKKEEKGKLKEMLCAHPERPLNFYCRDDQKCICKECYYSAHREHNTVAMQEERKEREQKVEEFLQKARGEIHQRELNLQKILSTSEYIKGSSKCAVEANDRVFTELKASVEKMKEGLNRTIQEQEKALVSQAQLEERQQRRALLSLQATIIDLETLPQVNEDVLFITKSQSLVSQQETDPVTVHVDENLSFEFAMIATKKVKEMLEDCCKDAIEKIQETVKNVQLVKASKETQTIPKLNPSKPVRRATTSISGSRPQIQLRLTNKLKTRQDFLKHACPLTMDLDTAHPSLTISDDHKRVSVSAKRSKNRSSLKRFDRWEQVLCKEPLRGGCFYWEVEWSGKGAFVGITLEDIARKGEGVECGLGRNVNSWCLECSNINHSAWHNNIPTTITDNISSPRIGIYLDHNAGRLTFYGVSDKMTLIHTYTSEKLSGPLYPAFGFGLDLRLQSCIKLQSLENT